LPLVPSSRHDPQVNPAALATYLERNFPAYATGRLDLIDRGWDFAVFAIDEGRVVRCARHADAALALGAEAAVLEAVSGPASPVLVPRCHFLWPGDPSRQIAFAVMDLLDGQPASRASSRLGAGFVGDLASMLRRVHALPADALPAALGGHTSDWTARWIAGLEEARGWILAELDAPLRSALEERVQGILRALDVDAPEACLVHGDLTADNLLVDDAGRLRGVLDWADATVADPAFDLRTLARFLPTEALDTLAAAYDPEGAPSLLRRARLYADLLPLEDAAWGVQSGMAEVVSHALLEFRSRVEQR
jgi:aminoglycoside phosphotransferase (APT) family kinase protein